MPGAVVMWLRYMFPHSTADGFGTARRRNIVLFEFLTTLVLYAVVLFFLTHPHVAATSAHILTLPIRTMFGLLVGR